MASGHLPAFSLPPFVFHSSSTRSTEVQPLSPVEPFSLDPLYPPTSRSRGWVTGKYLSSHLKLSPGHSPKNNWFCPRGMLGNSSAYINMHLDANVGNIRDTSSVPGPGRSPGGGHGNPLQYSCLENPVDRGAWQTTVHRVTKSQTRLKQLSMHTHMWYKR